jgi:hypothetical protein
MTRELPLSACGMIAWCVVSLCCINLFRSVGASGVLKNRFVVICVVLLLHVQCGVMLSSCWSGNWFTAGSASHAEVHIQVLDLW